MSIGAVRLIRAAAGAGLLAVSVLATWFAPVGFTAPRPAWAAAWPATSAPTVAVTPVDDRQYVFWRGGAGRLYETYFDGWWHGPITLPWHSDSAPTAAVTQDGHQYVAWAGRYRHIYEAWYSGAWHGPSDLTAQHRWGRLGLTSGPVGSAVNARTGRQYLFWRGLDGRIHEAWGIGKWHRPVNLGWFTFSAPAVGVARSGHQYVFWQRSDGDIEEAWYSGGWRGPVDLTDINGWGEFGQTRSAVAVAVNPANDHQYLFWRGVDGRTYEAWYDGSWKRPRNLGWGSDSAPTAGITVTGHQYVFCRAGDGALLEAWYLGAWQGPITPFQPTGPAPRVFVTQTTSDLAQRMTRVSDLRFAGLAPPGAPVINVDDAVRFQRVTGVGGALTDSSAWLIWDELSPITRSALISDLFGANGIHLDFTVVPMGGSDFTKDGRPYTYDDLPAGQTDPDLDQFSITHDLSYVVPALQQMLAVNPNTTIFAVPWTAPPWMKANGAYDDSMGRGTLLQSAYLPFANYFVKFLRAYADLGVPVDAIAPENEPDTEAPFPGMALPAAAESGWIDHYLKPGLQQAGLATKIYGGDSGWGSSAYVNALLSSPAAADVAGVAWHCYGGIPTVMSASHDDVPQADHVVTECSQGIMPYPVPEVLIGALRNWSSAVTLWNLALDPSGGPVQPPNYGCGGCTGIVTINELTHTVTFNLAYYQLGQVSAFVQPGAVRIASNTFVSFYAQNTIQYGATSGLDDAAFLNPDGTRILVAYNNSPALTRFAVRWRARTFAYSIPPWATTTFSWRP